jgi:hypothetical protein
MNKTIDNTELAVYYINRQSHVVTVAKYQQWVRDKDQVPIAEFLYHRLHSRYLKPYAYPEHNFIKEYKNGFGIMASCSLLIETLQCFKMGIADDTGQTAVVFKEFFASEDEFSKLEISGNEFFKHIRCGILHQGETTGGWSIRRNGTQAVKRKQIDAVRFTHILEKSLRSYAERLKNGDWESEIWRKFREKMEAVIKNCVIDA